MMNLLCAGTFFENFWAKMTILFGTFNFWVGVFLAAFGVALFILGKRLTRIHRAQDEVVKGDRVWLTYNILGSACVVAALVIWIFFC
ncbi:MAG: hypothetical protein IJA61_01675 [Clostridia bacterium]|nr:hypothetical protein [Clostridia bacterium]